MSRANNSVRLLGKVVKGPIARYTKENKIRCEYQLEVEGKGSDKGHFQAPFVRSLGNLAERDIKNIKTGDYVVVEGRLITRYEKKHHYFLKSEDPNNTYLRPIDPEEDDEDYPDNLIMESDIIRPITEVYADDVFYLGNIDINLSESNEE